MDYLLYHYKINFGQTRLLASVRFLEFLLIFCFFFLSETVVCGFLRNLEMCFYWCSWYNPLDFGVVLQKFEILAYFSFLPGWPHVLRTWKLQEITDRLVKKLRIDKKSGSPISFKICIH